MFTCLHLCVVQVFGVDEQEAVCVTRLTSQRSGTRDRGKPGRMETEVQKLKVFFLSN